MLTTVFQEIEIYLKTPAQRNTHRMITSDCNKIVELCSN